MDDSGRPPVTRSTLLALLLGRALPIGVGARIVLLFCLMSLLDSAASIDAATIAAVKCKGAIIKATAGFVQAQTKALQKCAQRIVTGKLPPGTDCHANGSASAAITKATAKLGAAIVRACAGDDGSCGTNDANEPAPRSVGTSGAVRMWMATTASVRSTSAATSRPVSSASVRP